MQKGNALIRHYFHKNPKKLDIDSWAEMVQEALWLKHFELKKLAELIGAMFGKDEDEDG